MNKENYEIFINKIADELRENLTRSEYFELLSLEYILTWNLSDNFDKDENRYIYLTNKKALDICSENTYISI